MAQRSANLPSAARSFLILDVSTCLHYGLHVCMEGLLLASCLHSGIGPRYEEELLTRNKSCKVQSAPSFFSGRYICLVVGTGVALRCSLCICHMAIPSSAVHHQQLQVRLFLDAFGANARNKVVRTTKQAYQQSLKLETQARSTTARDFAM